MPNLFKIDFIQGKTDATDYNQVKHSLIDTATNRAIISLSISACLLYTSPSPRDRTRSRMQSSA